MTSVIGLVEQYAAHLDLSYVNFIVEEPSLARPLCRSAGWLMLAGRRRAVRITCRHGQSARPSSQEEGVLRGLTVAVLLPAGRLRTVLQQLWSGHSLLIVSREDASPPARTPPNLSWAHAQLPPNNCTATLSGVWTFAKAQQPVIEPRGRWSAAAGQLCLRRTGPGGGPTSFQGRTVRFATTNTSGDVAYDAVSKGALIKTGFYGELIRFIETELQLRAEIVLSPEDGLCGEPDGVLCGPLALLRRRQADVAVGHFRVRPSSLGVVDFTAALQDYSYSFVVADPNRQTSAAAINWRSYSEPFSRSVWLCSAGLAGLVWLTWMLAQWTDGRRDPAGTAWAVLCISLQQGAELVPRSLSARQVVGCFWVFSIILLASYTSNIISLLVSVGRTLPFTTMQELAAKRGWLVAVQPDSRAAALLQGRPEMDNHVIVYQSSLKDSMERILHDDMVTVFTGHTEAEHLVRGSCGLVWTPMRLGISHTHWAMQKHLPYGGRISNVLSRLVEAGLVSRSQRPWAASDGRCRLPTASFQTISLRHTLTAFVLLALGVLTSLAVLCVERWLYRRRRGDAAP